MYDGDLLFCCCNGLCCRIYGPGNGESAGIYRNYNYNDLEDKFYVRQLKKTENNNKKICANVDLYSGLIYEMLDIPMDLYTPLFAVARVAGWSAHRIEELTTGGRIIRPAYKSVKKERMYIPIDER